MKYEIICKNYFQGYKRAGDIITGPVDNETYSTNFTFLLRFESYDVRVEREVWAYPTISLIADLGGALSLFVGVSFLSAWDCLEYLYRKYKQH